MRHIAIDTESTGFINARLVELAAIEFDPLTGVTGARFQSYVSPAGQKVDPGAYGVHGLSDSFLANKPLFRDVAAEFRKFIEGAIVYAHNAPFDARLLNAEFKRVGASSIEDLTSDVVCTLKVAKKLHPHFKSRKLDVMCDHYKVDRTKRGNHGALIDCDLLVQVYVNMRRDTFAMPAMSGSMPDDRNLSRAPANAPPPSASPTVNAKPVAKKEGWRPGGPWYEDETASLIDLHGRQIGIDDICTKHNRSFLSIAMQMAKLGLITQAQVDEMKAARVANVEVSMAP